MRISSGDRKTVKSTLFQATTITNFSQEFFLRTLFTHGDKKKVKTP